MNFTDFKKFLIASIKEKLLKVLYIKDCPKSHKSKAIYIGKNDRRVMHPGGWGRAEWIISFLDKDISQVPFITFFLNKN